MINSIMDRMFAGRSDNVLGQVKADGNNDERKRCTNSHSLIIVGKSHGRDTGPHRHVIPTTVHRRLTELSMMFFNTLRVTSTLYQRINELLLLSG